MVSALSAKTKDPSLKTLLGSIPDPFETWVPTREEGQLFNVLSP
jgi:hypothetical protein